jgi:2-dehydro-3-deoxyphosphooctonate aldolase (KDO 8-P synthase)
VDIGNFTLDDRRLFLIAGPCVIESEKLLIKVAGALKEITVALDMPFIFKSSYDKANRLSAKSFRGLGPERGLRVLANVRRKMDVPVICDVHSVNEVKPAAKVLDVIQIPAFLCRQTDLVMAAAKTRKPLNIKKGQFMSPWDMRHVAEKAVRAGNRKVILTERGTTFGYGNLVADMRSIPIMKGFGYPVVFDATHSVQMPGGRGGSSGGDRAMIPVLAKAAVAAGCDGVFLEVHPEPDSAPCDGPNMIELDRVGALLKSLKAIFESRG